MCRSLSPSSGPLPQTNIAEGESQDIILVGFPKDSRPRDKSSWRPGSRSLAARKDPDSHADLQGRSPWSVLAEFIVESECVWKFVARSILSSPRPLRDSFETLLRDFVELKGLRRACS